MCANWCRVGKNQSVKYSFRAETTLLLLKQKQVHWKSQIEQLHCYCCIPESNVINPYVRIWEETIQRQGKHLRNVCYKNTVLWIMLQTTIDAGFWSLCTYIDAFMLETHNTNITGTIPGTIPRNIPGMFLELLELFQEQFRSGIIPVFLGIIGNLIPGNETGTNSRNIPGTFQEHSRNHRNNNSSQKIIPRNIPIVPGNYNSQQSQ